MAANVGTLTVRRPHPGLGLGVGLGVGLVLGLPPRPWQEGSAQSIVLRNTLTVYGSPGENPRAQGHCEKGLTAGVQADECRINPQGVGHH